MTKRDVLSLALKIVGVVCIVVALTGLPAIIYNAIETYRIRGYGRSVVSYLILRELALAICAYTLIIFSTRIAKWMIPDDTAIQGTDNVWSGQEILMLVARMIGIYFLVIGLSSLGKNVVSLIFARSMEIPNYNAWMYARSELVREIIQIIAAIYLLSGAKAMITAIYNKWPGDELLDEEEETAVG